VTGNGPGGCLCEKVTLPNVTPQSSADSLIRRSLVACHGLALPFDAPVGAKEELCLTSQNSPSRARAIEAAPGMGAADSPVLTTSGRSIATTVGAYGSRPRGCDASGEDDMHAV
jgi:hypothetical protein